MCKHEVIKINDVRICRKCGFAMIDGRPFFDRRFVNHNKTKKRGKKK